MKHPINLACAAGLFLMLHVAPAAAQTSSSIVQSDLARQYAVIKKIIDAIDEAERKADAARNPSQGGEVFRLGDYDLDHCADGWKYVGSAARDDKALHLANLAVDAGIWKSGFQSLKYPAQVWEASLRDYENGQLGEVRRSQGAQIESRLSARKSAFLKQFAVRLGSYQQSHPSLEKVVSVGRCRASDRASETATDRAGEIGVRIETDPSGATVYIIPSFFYELCRAQKIDPDDRTRCNRWREALSGRVAQVAGDYFYIARWPDGATRQGNLSVVAFVDGAFVLRKP